MAKREFIDRTRLLTENMKSKYYHLANGDIAIPIIDIEHSHTITEQEIVKSYLEKIRSEINKLTVYYTTKDKGINLISQKAVNRIFDKYKAESEDK